MQTSRFDRPDGEGAPAIGRCSECLFWQPIGSSDGMTFGECRISSPVALPDDRAVWPQTLASDWCGDFMQESEQEETAQ